MRKGSNVPRRFQVRKDLLEYLKNSNIQAGSKLPTETELIDQFNVSRLSLREALHLLEEERIIRAVHGKGWYFIALPTNLEANISRIQSVTEMFSAIGLDLKTKLLSFEFQILENDWDAMQLKKGDSIVAIERIRYSNSEPFIYSIDYIPNKFLKGKFTPEMVSGSLLNALENEFGLVLDSSFATIRVAEKESFADKDLGLVNLSSWLLLEQINYDPVGTPIIFSKDYHRSDKVQFYAKRYRSGKAKNHREV
jgi:GntR family transcriptional regulator